MLIFIVFIMLLHYIRLLHHNPLLFVTALQEHPNELRLLSNNEKKITQRKMLCIHMD